MQCSFQLAHESSGDQVKMQILILLVWEGSKILHFNILPGVYQMNKKHVRIIDCLSPGNRFLLENGSGTAGWRAHKWGRSG